METATSNSALPVACSNPTLQSSDAMETAPSDSEKAIAGSNPTPQSSDAMEPSPSDSEKAIAGSNPTLPSSDAMEPSPSDSEKAVACSNPTQSSDATEQATPNSALTVACSNLTLPSSDAMEPTTSNNALNVVWDGPNDPLHPRNWSKRRKWTNFVIVSAQATIAPVASTFLAVSDLVVAEDFHITNVYLPGLPIAIFVLGQGLGPLYLAPCSEIFGRRKIYVVAFVIFTALNAGCALAKNMLTLVILRFLCGMAGSAGPVLGAGTISDMFPAERRGRVQALYGLGPQAGPVLGGVIGGFILNATGTWRWLLWIMTIISGLMTLISFLLLHESYGPFLLEKKAKNLRKETGNADYKVEGRSNLRPRELFLHSITRPLRMLFEIPICTILSLYASFIVGIFYIFLTTFALLFGPTESYGLFSYRWHHGHTGLSFLAAGVGLIWATIIGITCLNRSQAWMTARYGNGETRPEFRMPLLQVGMVLAPLGLVVFGWSAQKQTHWIVPLLGVAVFTCGNQIAYVSIQTYIIDAFETYAASALAGSAVSRGVVGCILTVFGFKLFVGLGYGWGTTLLACVCVAALPIPTILYFYGPRLRKSKFVW